MNALKKIAKNDRPMLACGLKASVLWLVVGLTACSALPERPQRPALYDFGPGLTAPVPQDRRAPLPPLALADIDAAGALEGATAVLYRLGYAGDQQLHPYAQARWSQPPAQLVRQHLRDHLSRRRAVLNAGEGPALMRADQQLPLVLRLELEEFSQLFDSPQHSAGLVRLRATLVNATPAGERLLGQRLLVARQPAPSPDAAGGVKALTEATGQIAQELEAWLEQVSAAAR